VVLTIADDDIAFDGVAPGQITEAGAANTSFGYTRRRMFLTTESHPDAQLLAPLVDPFGNPLGGANVSWARGTACQPEGFCETAQDGVTRSAMDGWAVRTVTPGSGSKVLYRPSLAHPPAAGAQGQGARHAAAPAAGGDPRLGYLDIDLDAVRGGDLPSPTEAVEMERWQRFEIAQRQRSAGGSATGGEGSADAAHVMAMLDGPGCSGATLTCGDDTPVFEPVRVDLGSGESLQDVTLRITDGTNPVTELDGDTVLTEVPLTLEASVVIREPGGGTHEVPITDPVPVFVTPDTGAAIEDPAAGATCTALAIPPGPFVYHVGKHAGGSFTYIDENGDACCWAATEELHATVVAAMDVDDGQGGTIAVTKRVETTVPSTPRPADACQVRAYPQDAPEIAGYGPWDSTQETEQWQEVGAVYLTDACGNILHDLGKNDSPDHNQPGDEFHITGVTPDQGGEVYATAAMDQFQWLYHLKLHGAHDFGNNKVGIPEGIYQINLEIASTADCGDGAHIADAYTADYANGRPVMELHWDLGRGAEPTNLTASPEAALRDPATGDVAAWRVLPIDAGQVPEENHGATYTDVPVKLYVASVTKTFDRDGNLVEDYQQIPGVELCTGEVHQLIDADHPWPGQVTATCDQTHPDEFTTTVSSDPAGAWVWGGAYDGPLGISVGLTKAPSEPGDYYLVAEPLDESFRRGQSWKVDHGIGWPKPVVRFTVMGGVFLDENWQRIPEPIEVDDPHAVHVVLHLPDTGDEAQLDFVGVQQGQDLTTTTFTAQAVGPPDKGMRTYIGDLLLMPYGADDPGGYTGYTRVVVPQLDFDIDIRTHQGNRPQGAGMAKTSGAGTVQARAQARSAVTVIFTGLMPGDPEDDRHVLISNCPEAVFDGSPCRDTTLFPAPSQYQTLVPYARVLDVHVSFARPLMPELVPLVELWLRYDDVDDTAVYEGELQGGTWVPDTDPDDNLCDQPFEEHFLRWTGTSYGASDYTVYPPDGKKYLHIPVDTDGTAKLRFKVSKCPGDNYAIRGVLRLKNNPRNFQQPWLSATGAITGFERLFIEVDKAAKRGFYLKQDISPGPAPPDGVKVWVFHDFAKTGPGDPKSPKDKVLEYFECDKDGAAPYTCCEAFAAACPSSQSKPYRPVFFVDGRPERRFDPAHPENSDIAYIRGVSCTIQQNLNDYNEYIFENECVFELVDGWQDGSPPHSFSRDYDAFEWLGGTNTGGGWAAGMLVANAPSGGDSPVVETRDLLTGSGIDPLWGDKVRLNALPVLADGFWEVVFLRDADILPPYPRTRSLLVDPANKFSDVYSLVATYNGPPDYLHYVHQSPGTKTQCGSFPATAYCKETDNQGRLKHSAFADDEDILGLSPTCVTQSRSSILFQEADLGLLQLIPKYCADAMVHEALHLFDLNVPIDPQTGVALLCTDSFTPPPVCTAADPAPWCSDHSIDGKWVGQPPAGMPEAVIHDGLMVPAPDDPLTVRYHTCLSTEDPSNGQAGVPGAKKYALRDHAGLEGAQ